MTSWLLYFRQDTCRWIITEGMVILSETLTTKGEILSLSYEYEDSKDTPYALDTLTT